jgi:hypothetical protein
MPCLILICRYKLLFMLFVTQGVCHGPRTMKRRRMQIFLIGCKLCLAFRLPTTFISEVFMLMTCLWALASTKNPPLLIHVLSLHPPPLQKDNVSNQREHLILLLANVHIRQLSKPEQQPKVLAFAKYTCERCVHMNPCVMILFTHFLLVIFSVRWSCARYSYEEAL